MPGHVNISCTSTKRGYKKACMLYFCLKDTKKYIYLDKNLFVQEKNNVIHPSICFDGISIHIYFYNDTFLKLN